MWCRCHAGGAEFLQRFGAGLVQILVGFIGNVKERGMLALLPVMDLVIQASWESCCELPTC